MLKILNEAIDYIEENLTEDIALGDIARHIGARDYHFRQMFQAISGIPLSEYLKKRRLSAATYELMKGSSVTEVAFKYGYQSVDGFSRAFKAWSGYLPSEIYKNQISISFPKLSFYIDVKGGENMEVKIIEMPAFYIAGVQKCVPMQFEGVNRSIVELAESISEGQKEEMHQLQNIEPEQIINASYDADHDFRKEEGELIHMIGVITTDENISSNLDSIKVEAHKWAVFPVEGEFPSAMQNITARTHSEWLPSTDYELVDAPGFSFTIMDKERQNYAYSEIWLAVK